MPVQYQIDGTIDAIAMLLYHLYHICVIKNRQYLENYRLFCLFLVTFLLTGQIVDIRSKLLCYLHKSIRFSQVISETLPGSYHGFMITAFVFRPAKTPAPRNRCSKWNFTLDGLFLFFCLRFIKTGRIDAFHYPWYIPVFDTLESKKSQEAPYLLGSWLFWVHRNVVCGSYFKNFFIMRLSSLGL